MISIPTINFNSLRTIPNLPSTGLSNKWIQNNYNPKYDKRITIQLDNQETQIDLLRYGWFYSIDYSIYSKLTEEQLDKIISSAPNEFFCTLREGLGLFFHYTKATQSEIESKGLLASGAENTTLGDGIYCFSYLHNEPDSKYGNYVEINYMGPYFECIYDPDPSYINNVLTGKDGYEYKDDGTRTKNDTSRSYTEYLLPVYNIHPVTLTYHEA